MSYSQLQHLLASLNVIRLSTGADAETLRHLADIAYKHQMPNQTEREAFEAYAGTSNLELRDDGGYQSGRTSDMWDAWMHRADIEKESK